MPDRTLMVSFINSNFFKVGVQIKLKQPGAGLKIWVLTDLPVPPLAIKAQSRWSRETGVCDESQGQLH